jgi:UDP-glucuronate 4-epimerase
MKLIVTGAAGFIGSALVEKLLSSGNEVCGIDNHNNYYDPAIKEARLARLERFPSYKHFRTDLSDKSAIVEIFEEYKPSVVVNLAAQAGVRYSIENPHVYIESNIVGFINIIEACRIVNVAHLVYASSSSVYGANEALPFSEHDSVDHPLSLYAATKRSNELMAHAYSHLHGLPTTGLRFFTVYGPWGRPDMALFKFTKAIISGDEIQVFNNGLHRRDFTYIDDVTEGIVRVIESPTSACANWDPQNPDTATSKAPWKIYNIGSNNPTNLMDYIGAIERELGKQANVVFLPLQPGDVTETHANTSEFAKRFDYQPATPVEKGINKFIEWYLEYFSGR